MKSNIKLNVAFCNLSNKKFAIISSDPTYFYEYMNGMNCSLENIEHTISIEEITVKTKSHESVHKALQVLDVSATILTAENVYTVEQLHTWLAIKAGTYQAKEDWDIFLHTNSLLNDWIDGGLSIKTAYTYNERSKELGYKKDIKKIDAKLSSYNEIWDLPNLFKGKSTTTHGTYAKYSYTQASKIIQMSVAGRTVVLNQDWLQEFDLKTLEYKLSDFKIITK
jgi:hypothetical protein